LVYPEYEAARVQVLTPPPDIDVTVTPVASALAKSTSRSPTCWGETASEVVLAPALKTNDPTADTLAGLVAALIGRASRDPNARLKRRTNADADAIAGAHV
jgi:hypothetical protein